MLHCLRPKAIHVTGKRPTKTPTQHKGKVQVSKSVAVRIAFNLWTANKEGKVSVKKLQEPRAFHHCLHSQRRDIPHNSSFVQQTSDMPNARTGRDGRSKRTQHLTMPPTKSEKPLPRDHAQRHASCRLGRLSSRTQRQYINDTTSISGNVNLRHQTQRRQSQRIPGRHRRLKKNVF